jgi:hypothetical protein
MILSFLVAVGRALFFVLCGKSLSAAPPLPHVLLTSAIYPRTDPNRSEPNRTEKKSGTLTGDLIRLKSSPFSTNQCRGVKIAPEISLDNATFIERVLPDDGVLHC